MKLELTKKIRNRHIGYFGTTGCGKTNAMMQLYEQLSGKKIIIDAYGDYYQVFADKEDDVFCPFSHNSVGWDLFADLQTKLDVINFSRSLIPLNPHSKDPFWDQAAQTIVESVMLYLAKRKGSTNRDVWQIISSIDEVKRIKSEDEEVKRIIENFTQEKDIKLTSQVLANVISKREVRALEFLSYVEGDFSFRQWVRNEGLQNSLYLLANERFQSVLLPLYRTVLDLITEEILDLKSDDNREITLIVDELPKLGKLERIVDLLTLARKKGCGVVYSAQNYSLLEKVYSKDADTILINTNTAFIFRMKKAKEFESFFDKQEIYQYAENISMGPSDISDRLGTNRQKVTKNTVLSSEIGMLEDLQAYVTTIYPRATKVKFKYIKRDIVNEIDINDKSLQFSE